MTSGNDPVAPFDLGSFATRPLEGRAHLVETDRFGKPVEEGTSIEAFLDSLPDYLGVRAMRGLAAAIVEARRKGAPVLVGLGGHVVKVGLGPILIDLMERGYIQGFVLNGASAIHDSEVATVGSTSEDVAEGLFDGTYGSAEETGSLFARAARRCVEDGIGFGTALGRTILDEQPRNPHLSILCAATKADIPITIHVAVGTDTVHMHPACRGDDVGTATHRDFKRLATLVDGLDGGVYVNIGSAVILPEVFMKAVAIVHNARPDRRVHITTGNLDMLRHYRPRVNVIQRPAVEGFDIAGHHEFNVPLLRMAILAAATRTDTEPSA